MKYAIYRPDQGYMCEGEDNMNGVGYDETIDEYTVKFDKLEHAELNRCKGEMIVILDNNEVIGVAEFKRMTKEEVMNVYGKVL